MENNTTEKVTIKQKAKAFKNKCNAYYEDSCVLQAVHNGLVGATVMGGVLLLLNGVTCIVAKNSYDPEAIEVDGEEVEAE